MARFDLVLSKELCRLSNRRCGKTPPDKLAFFLFHLRSIAQRLLVRGEIASLLSRPARRHKGENKKSNGENKVQSGVVERPGVSDPEG